MVDLFIIVRAGNIARMKNMNTYRTFGWGGLLIRVYFEESGEYGKITFPAM
jgi:hypothetical protein